MNVEEMVSVLEKYFPDVPVLLESLRRYKKLVAAEFKPDEDSLLDKIEKYFIPNSETPKMLDICRMSGDKLFSSLLLHNPETKKAAASWEVERFKQAWTKLRQELAGGPVNVIGFFICLDNEAFIQALNVAAKKELVSLKDTGISAQFRKALRDEFGFFDGKWKVDFSFDSIVVHSPDSLYNAFLFYGHARYTLRYLDYLVNPEPVSKKDQKWAFKIIEDMVFEKYKYERKKQWYKCERKKQWKKKPTKDDYYEWRAEFATPIQYAMERYSDNPYIPAGSVEEILKNVVQEEKRFPKELKGKNLPFDRKDMEMVSPRSELMKCTREFLKTLSKEEQETFTEEAVDGSISLVKAMYNLRGKYPQYRDKLGNNNDNLEYLYLKLADGRGSLDEKIDDESDITFLDEVTDSHDRMRTKNDLTPEEALDIKEQMAVLIPLFKKVFAEDSGYCAYLEGEATEAPRIICQDLHRFCWVLAEREKGTESAKGKHFDQMHLYKNYVFFSNSKEKLKANEFTKQIQELRKLAVKKPDTRLSDVVFSLLCLEEEEK